MFVTSSKNWWAQIEARILNLPAELVWVSENLPEGFHWPILALLAGLSQTPKLLKKIWQQTKYEKFSINICLKSGKPEMFISWLPKRMLEAHYMGKWTAGMFLPGYLLVKLRPWIFILCLCNFIIAVLKYISYITPMVQRKRQGNTFLTTRLYAECFLWGN